MNEREADLMAARLLSLHGDVPFFEVSLGDDHDYQALMQAFARIGCPTGPDGEFHRLKVYPKRDIVE